MTKRLSIHEKKNRRPASRACTFCHEKHLQCSNERPCKNCVKRKIAHQCHDTVRKRAKYLHTAHSSSGNASGNVTNTASSTANSSPTPTPRSSAPNEEVPGAASPSRPDLLFNPHSQSPLPAALPKPNTVLNTTNDVLNKILFDQDKDSEFVAGPAHHDSHRNSTSSNPLSIFSSNYLNQEYLMLGDIILQSKPSSPSPSNTSASEHNNTTAVSPANFINVDQLTSTKKTLQKHKDSRPFISLGYDSFPAAGRDNAPPDLALDPAPAPVGASETSQSALPAMSPLGPEEGLPESNGSAGGGNPIVSKLTQTSSEYVSPLITHHLYRTVPDIYTNNIINFDYPQSYHSLTHFLKKRFSGNNLSLEERQNKRKNLLIILKLIASYRPTFISAHKSLLKPWDLQLLEMSFQRSLIDYERLSHLNSSPTIIWRRTGEIVSMTDDLLSILGYDINEILSKRTFIVELMHDDESIINYYKLFKSVAVGNLHSSIVTKCKLNKGRNHQNGDKNGNANAHDESEYIDFRSVWTVKRDLFDLPMLIIGQFLPILPAGDGVRMY